LGSDKLIGEEVQDVYELCRGTYSLTLTGQIAFWIVFVNKAGHEMLITKIGTHCF